MRVVVAAVATIVVTSPVLARVQQQLPRTEPVSQVRRSLDLEAEAQFRLGTVAEDTPGLVKARVLVHVEPKYTSDAMRQKLQGAVVVDVVISDNGHILRARIATSLDKVFGLDAEALKAIYGWRFEPAMLNGKAVSTVEHITMEFRLH